AAEKQRWAARLEAVAGRAGDHAELNKHEAGDETLTGPERERIKNLVLSSGAPKTMAVHIRRWEKLERWCSANSVVLYPLTIDAVVKYALFLDSKECGPTVIPSLRSALKWVGSRLAIKLPDLQDKRLLALETDVFQKRAKMIKEAVAMPFEVVQAMEKFVCSGKEPAAARIFTWWLLCMVFASLRFDDAIHVKPLELEMRPNASADRAPSQLEGSRSYGPQVYPQSYTRNRSTIPAVMMQQLVADLKDAFAPKCVSKDDLVDEVDDDLLPIAEFFLKIPDGSASSYEYKCHCSSKTDYQIVAC
ncbi:unnamed protein product, partial [Symbiodinium pilosum]